MKYKDYLIIPIIAMYIVLTSFAYVKGEVDEEGEVVLEPAASISPEEISLGDDTWYADGSRSSDSFNGGTVSSFSINDMHLLCSTTEGKSYDLIFVDSMTAYDCVTDTYYQRADYDTLLDDIVSGKFINTQNYNDYYVFKENGKSIEYFGDKVYKGRWSLDTAQSISVYDNVLDGFIEFEIKFDSYGNVVGISNGEFVYNLVT